MKNKATKKEEEVEDTKAYYFDLEKIYEFVTLTDNNPPKEQEILDTYETDGSLSQKTIRELYLQGNNQTNTIRYDLIKTIIMQILNIGTSETSLGDSIAVETMLKGEFLKCE